MSIWRWADHIEAVPQEHRITLGEGNTPLVPSRKLGPSLGLANLAFKLEISNPTASYKDRFAASAISHMKANGQTRCIATSSGNTGASLAAYCALADVECVIAIVETAPEGKLKQMLAYGAKLYRVEGFGLDPAITSEVMETIAAAGSASDASSEVSTYVYSPKGMSAVMTLSFELAEQCANLDHVFCPAGGGGMVLAVARGFARMVELGKLARSPRVEIVQPAGNDTMASPLREGASEAREVQCTTRVSGLQVPNVLDGTKAILASRETGGTGHAVSDEEVWEVQRRLAREEGIFCEPAGATSVAGAVKAARNGEIAPDASVVCFVTGSGFKDPSAIERMLDGASAPVVPAAEFSSILGG